MSTTQPAPLTRGQRWSLAAAALCAVGAVLLAALPMDWLEQGFDVEPDGGNGLFELVPVLVLATAALILCVRVARARRRSEAPATDTA